MTINHDSELARADRIAFVGDVHGDLRILRKILDAIAAHGIRQLVQVGDFGLLWPGASPDRQVRQLAEELDRLNLVLSWVDGNHEDFDQLARFRVDHDGLRRLAPNIRHMPHGYRTNLATGHTLAVLGGANSVDKYLRTRRTWWPEESITASDLEQLGTSHADILVGHDAPLNVPSLDRYLDSTSSSIPFDMLEYGDHGRAMFYKGFTQVRPQLSISGHYHHPIDQIVGFGNGDNGFASRVVVLDQIRARDTASVALLAVRDLKLRFFSSAGDEVPVVPQIYELRPDDFGRWLVTTRTSSYVFNLDDSTVESLAGADVSNSVPAHQPMRLRRLDLCKIGQPGRWTLQAFGSSLDPDLSRHISSIVRTIDPLPAK